MARDREDFFRFKRFTIVQRQAAQKAGTDGVLLGAWVRLHGNERHILDVGTGTGVIALMLAQRSEKTQAGNSEQTVVIGVDIDGASAEEAAANFRESNWAGRMAAFKGDIRGLGADENHGLRFLAFPYDLIVSNPPFFVASLKAPDKRRSDARHSDSLPYMDLIDTALRNLAPEGRLALILPVKEAGIFEKEAEEAGLHPCRRCLVSTRAGAAPRRMMLELSTALLSCEESSLAIQDENGFTEEYRFLTRDFYLKF